MMFVSSPRRFIFPLAMLGLGWVGLGNAAAIATPEAKLETVPSESISGEHHFSPWRRPTALALPSAIPKAETKPTPADRGISGLLPPPTAVDLGPAPSPWEVSPTAADASLDASFSAPQEPAPALAQGEELEELPADPELGVIRVRNPLEDPELGILRIRDRPNLPASPAPPKVGFLTTRFSVVNSDNVLLVVNDVGGLTGDTFYRPAASLAFYPSLGPQTALIGSLDVGLQRYGSQPALNYDDWQVQLALRQGLSPRSYVQVGVTYQELLRTGGSRFRFFDNRAVALTLGRRDPFTPKLALDSFYRVQWNDSLARFQTSDGVVVTDFSRLSQTAGAYLGYTLSPQWHTGLNYQISLNDYTRQDRYDTVHQLLGQAVYSITPQVRLSLYGGWSFGRSSDLRLRFDDTIFGFTIDATVPLF